MWWGLIASACAPTRPPPVPAPAGGAIARVAIAGGVREVEPSRWAQILADVEEWAPDTVIWTGDLAAGARGWRALPTGLDALAPALAVPGAADLRGDARGRRFAGRFASGGRWMLDAPGWRVVGVPGASTPEALEAGFWLPRVLGPTADYARAVVILGGPPRSLVPDLPPTSAPRLAAIAREAAAERLPLVVGGGSGANELFLPDGPYGTAVLIAGNAGGAGHPWPDRPVVGLQADFARAVAIERHLDADARSPLAGWWTLVLAPEALDVTFRMLTERGPREVLRGAWTPDGGWRWDPV